MPRRKRAVRGIRDSITGNRIIGRLGAGKGAATEISLADLAAALGSAGSGNGLPSGGATQIAIEMYAGGTMRANEVIGQIIAPVTFILEIGLPGAYAIASAASTGTIVLSIRKATSAVGIGTEIGTITFTSSNVGVIVFVTQTTFDPGERLLITCPSPSDLTLANTTVLMIGAL